MKHSNELTRKNGDGIHYGGQPFSTTSTIPTTPCESLESKETDDGIGKHHTLTWSGLFGAPFLSFSEDVGVEQHSKD